MNDLKHAINQMLSDYQYIQAMQVQNVLTLEHVQKCFDAINTLINTLDQNGIAFNIIADLISYETSLFMMINKQDISRYLEINFRCRYSLPQSGYDCVYINHETDEVYLTLYDAK